MGLAIEIYLADGTVHTIAMCYSSFSRKVMNPDEMVKYGFTDYDGVYEGVQLLFLITRLVRSGYLETGEFESPPLTARFC